MFISKRLRKFRTSFSSRTMECELTIWNATKLDMFPTQTNKFQLFGPHALKAKTLPTDTKGAHDNTLREGAKHRLMLPLLCTGVSHTREKKKGFTLCLSSNEWKWKSTEDELKEKRDHRVTTRRRSFWTEAHPQNRPPAKHCKACSLYQRSVEVGQVSTAIDFP